MSKEFIFLKYIYRILKNLYVNASINGKNKNVTVDHRAIIVDIDNNLQLSGNNTIGAYSLVLLASPPNLKIQSTLSIGENSTIGEFNNIRAVGECFIGENCLISQNVSLIGANHKYDRGDLITNQDWDTEKMGFFIGDDVWVGCNAVILPGIVVGNGVVIAAGSVVTKNLDEYCIYAGVPAKKIGERKYNVK